MDLYRRSTRWLGRTRGWALFFRRTAPHIDRFMHRVTRGKHTVAEAFLPTLILVHKGARSGNEYRTPLSFVELGESYGLAATNWGQKHHPGWSANLIAHPDVSIEHHGKVVAVRARRLGDEEKERLWPRFVDMWPAYGEYAKRSGRNIRLFVLEPR